MMYFTDLTSEDPANLQRLSSCIQQPEKVRYICWYILVSIGPIKIRYYLNIIFFNCLGICYTCPATTTKIKVCGLFKWQRACLHELSYLEGYQYPIHVVGITAQEPMVHFFVLTKPPPNRTVSLVFLVTESCYENKDASRQSLYRFSNRNEI